MDEELTALAAAGAVALVAAMATDLWQGTRNAFAALLNRRAGRRALAAVEAQLDNNAALVRDAEAPAEVRRALLAFWTLELEGLLRRDPACREPLDVLVREAREAARGPLAGGGEGHRAPARPHLEQTNTARDSGTVFAVQGGDQPIGGGGGGGGEADARR
ncbi:hypothetical protein [Streptomyces radicis]|uniref:Uncharacterized protein n=1 Tax=Streptomyces radicis TaxID=1750517 RepID=A0A3A9WZ24_9ACTN|nr:hypothetical protein [Streptomyces radicis]RKN11447.1 hypothetical protein D7319_05760 [Streptomyces radicis]RKN26533.1 hypothetical protein D7318_03900 [Streptomyces radicis]